MFQTKRIFILLFLFCFKAHALDLKSVPAKAAPRINLPSTYSQLSRLVNKISKERIKGNLDLFLLQTHPSRIVGGDGHDKAPLMIQKYIKSIHQGLPLAQQSCCDVQLSSFTPDLDIARKMYRDDFEREIVGKFPPSDPTYKKWKTFTDSTLKFLDGLKSVKGTNVIWEKKGTIDPDSVILIGAHFDSMAHDSKTFTIQNHAKISGADDNGSGVAVALGLIELLAPLPLPKTVKIIFYDFGQVANLGAVDFARKNSALMASKKLAGHLDLLMLGHDSKDKDSEKALGNMKMYLKKPDSEGSERELKFAQWLHAAGKKSVGSINFAITQNGMNNGNGQAYWSYAFPTLVFSENWETDLNPFYHTTNDFAETLNVQTLYKSYQFIASGVLAWSMDIMQ